RDPTVALVARVLGYPRLAKVTLLIRRHLAGRRHCDFRFASFAEKFPREIVTLNRDSDAVARPPLNHGHRTDPVETEARDVEHVGLVHREVAFVAVERVLQAPGRPRTGSRLLEDVHTAAWPGQQSAHLARPI